MGDCLCLNMASENKDFVNSVSAQNRMLSQVVCSVRGVNTCKCYQRDTKCRVGRIYDDFPEDKFNQDHYVLLHND